MSAKKRQKGKPEASRSVKAKATPPRADAGARDLSLSRQAVYAAAVLMAATVGTAVLGIFESTYQAGMAVPGWPGSFNSPWIFCPPDLWFGAPDVFLAQTHRVLGYVVAAAAIWLGIALRKSPADKTLWRMSVAAIAGVPLLVVSGGLRIAWDRTAWAAVHAVLAALFLTLIAGLVSRVLEVMRRQKDASRPEQSPASPVGYRTALLAAGLIALQIVAGSQLRHVSPASEGLYLFLFWVWTHVLLAAGLAVLAVVLYRVSRGEGTRPPVRTAMRWLAALIGAQLVVGPTDWVLRYNFPLWFRQAVLMPHFTAQQGGVLQTAIDATHVALGYASMAAAGVLIVISYFSATTSAPSKCSPRKESRDE